MDSSKFGGVRQGRLFPTWALICPTRARICAFYRLEEAPAALKPRRFPMLINLP
jgi:hypothetical protein